MEPIGASSTWRWYGYENSWVEVDGQKVQSVSGGGHWGGGMFINSYDMARFGYLFLRNGKWKDRTIVSEKWIQMARTPGPDNKTYGYANWYLNTERKPLPAAPATAVRFVGNGSNIIYIDWDNDIVAVFRWIGRRGAERGDRQDDVVDEGEDHWGPVRPRFENCIRAVDPSGGASLSRLRSVFAVDFLCHCRPHRRNNERRHVSHESRFRPDINPSLFYKDLLFELLCSIHWIGQRGETAAPCVA